MSRTLHAPPSCGHSSRESSSALTRGHQGPPSLAPLGRPQPVFRERPEGCPPGTLRRDPTTPTGVPSVRSWVVRGSMTRRTPMHGPAAAPRRHRSAPSAAHVTRTTVTRTTR